MYGQSCQAILLCYKVWLAGIYYYVGGGGGGGGGGGCNVCKDVLDTESRWGLWSVNMKLGFARPIRAC